MNVFVNRASVETGPPARPRSVSLVLRVWMLCWLAGMGSIQAAEARAVIATVESFEGTALFARAGAGDPRDPVYLGLQLSEGDRIITGSASRIALRMADSSVPYFGERSDFIVTASSTAVKPKSRFNLRSGLMYFFHRRKPADAEIDLGGGASAAVRGTEFVLEKRGEGEATVIVLDGEVELRNPLGEIRLTNGVQGSVRPGQKPVASPALDLVQAIQWALYYPGVLDIGELPLTDAERKRLRDSLELYRLGALAAALQAFPENLPSPSSAERVYHAALLLSVGLVEVAEAELDATRGQDDRLDRLGDALRVLIATVKGQYPEPIRPPELATEWLAESYRQQALHHLPESRAAARAAATRGADFGFAHARLAELEFSFGDTHAADASAARALELSPRHAQAVALQGFLFASQGRIAPAEQEFDRAIALDSALANARLGRGLARIRQGRGVAGREDLLVAAALEPRRAALRSYLAKAWVEARLDDFAAHELELAKQLDPNDPTAYLYSALLKEQNSEINDAVRELEQAQNLGDNRSLYRSRFLLDQDRAVRSANLARIYRDAGMNDASLREAGRAVAEDYGNYSAHLFLANSYDQFRDPNRISLRYETPAEAEYLIANILAPAGAGTLSQSISQGEYSKLFEGDGMHVVSSTEYLSRGAWSQNGAQFGTFGNTSYSVEGVYRTDPGQWFNGDFEERELRLHFKQQLTPDDSLYLRIIDYESEGGDRFQRLNPTLDYASGGPNPALRTRETQRPALALGYAHQWSPGSRLLFLAGRVEDTYEVSDPTQPGFLITTFDGVPLALAPMTIEQQTQTDAAVYHTELQQIWQTEKHLTVLGGRYQHGDLEIVNWHGLAAPFVDLVPKNTTTSVDTSIDRGSLYGYHSWQILEPLTLTGGAVLDWMRYPENFRYAPMSDEEQDLSRISPKAGFIWKPDNRTAIRGAYSRFVTGATLDQSLTLEPTQVASLNQAFRSTMPESLVGSTSGDRAELLALSVERSFASGTYVGVAGEILRSRSPRSLGTYFFDAAADLNLRGSLREDLRYRERALALTVDQLAGQYFTFGASYRVSEASLRHSFPQMDETVFVVEPLQRWAREKSLLHTAELRVVFNHPSGFFGRISGLWTAQEELDGPAPRPDEDTWSMDVFAGYRLPRRNAQITVGVMNLLDRDYRLHPLNAHAERPRERTFVGRLDLAF